MSLTDQAVLHQARAAYERARVKLGLGVSVLVALVPLISLSLGGRTTQTALLGVVLVVGTGTLVWRGGLASLSAMSGLKAGLVPLVFAHAANLYGHVCIPGQGCSTLCVPACALGGILAGFSIDRVARGASQPNVVRGVSAVVAFVAGSLGCACVGSGGLIGLSVGLLLSMAASRALVWR